MRPDPRSAAFLAHLEIHRGIVHVIAAQFARTSADRDDLSQEILARLWSAFATYDPKRATFSTWMYRVALNVAISYARGAERRSHDRTVDVGVPLDLPAYDHDPNDVGDDVLALRRSIADLSELDRALIVLHLEGCTYAEIAEIMGLTATNIATKLTRIKTALRRAIAAARMEPTDAI
jgi:RNA polymerase sigma-70 factor (ECF subfamily)